MEKWEYKLISQASFCVSLSVNNLKEEEKWLNNLGSEGWELYEYTKLITGYDIYKFKRKIISNKSNQK